MSTDPNARRDTPLALKLKAQIQARGPMPVAQFMHACLYDREHGYYRQREAIGRTGDFITAPEISQIFGELIGLWCVVVWRSVGSPSPVNLVEFGPGRGTMMADVLRAGRADPAFIAAARILLIERNPLLRATQAKTLAAAPCPVRHAADGTLTEISGDGPAILLANEFLDCQPVRQFLYDGEGRDGEWHDRTVELDAHGQLQFGIGKPVPMRAGLALPLAKSGDILEQRPTSGFIEGIQSFAATRPVAALFIDYGHAAIGYGDTLQAVRAHAPEHPLASPGEADLTAQVDFAALALDVPRLNHEQAARSARRPEALGRAAPLAVDGPVTQAEFLGRLGIVERAHALMAANPALAGEIEAGVARLIAVPGMGDRFKVIGLRRPDMLPLPGF